jgi:hypothetical protein
VPDEATCAARRGHPSTGASCCDACLGPPVLTFAERRCPSAFAPPACAAAAERTCHEAFLGTGPTALCATGHGTRSTYFAPEDGGSDGGTSRAWSFAIRPRNRRFYGNYPEVTGSLRITGDGLGAASTTTGATDEAHLRLSAPGEGRLLLVLRWFTAGLPSGTAARLRVAAGADVVLDVAEAPGAAVERLRSRILTWQGEVDLAAGAALTAPRDTPVPSADLLWHLAFLDLTGDADHDGVQNQADPHPLERNVPTELAPSPRPKVLVVGLDGAGWDVLDPLMQAGYLPTLASVVGSSARAFVDETQADPEFCCYCPPVWSSLITGWPATRHTMYSADGEPWDRPVPSVASLLERHGGTVTQVAFRNTWPPEPGTTYSFGEHSFGWVVREKFDVWPAATVAIERGETINRLQWTWPPLLFERLGVLPHVGPRPPLWLPFAGDRMSAESLAALAPREQTDLTMWLLHSPDKAEHVTWCTIQPIIGEPLNVQALLAEAAAWTGPVLGGKWAVGTVASQSLEADLHLGSLLGQVRYDYVVLLSDHAMSRAANGLFCGNHNVPPAFHGVFAVSGPGVRAGVDLGVVSVLDVAPTLAYLLDLPVAADLPGRVVAEAFTAEQRASQPVRVVPAW